LFCFFTSFSFIFVHGEIKLDIKTCEHGGSVGVTDVNLELLSNALG
jgi:hypothetical protein